MRLFKYRDLSGDSDESLARLREVLCDQAFWAASAKTLNDPDEFFWDVDYAASAQTARHLAEALMRHRGLSAVAAREMATHAVVHERVQTVSAPIIGALQHRFRAEVGLVCFGRTSENATLWDRYASSGCGVCIELEVPDALMSKQVYNVKYVDDKRVHVDTFLSATGESGAWSLFEAALLTKPRIWQPEEEIRFVAKAHSVSVRLDRSRVTRLVLGDRLSSGQRTKLDKLVRELPYSLALGEREA